MVINHLDKLFVTSDTSTIISELEVQHPAARMVVLAAQAQQQEVGDGTNLVVSLAGDLLANAADLVKEGLQPLEVGRGYQAAAQMALDHLTTLIHPGSEGIDLRHQDTVATRLKASISTKQFGFEDVLAPLVAQACISVLGKNAKSFNVDNVRVCKLVGGTLHNSSVVKGLVIPRSAEGAVTGVEDAKVVVYAQGVEANMTETKGTVLIKDAEQLMNYAKSEEAAMEKVIASIAASGVKLVVSGSAVSEIALHFFDKHGIMCLRINSKFELRRICRATGAVALVKFEAPRPDDLGFAKECSLEEMGGMLCTVLRQDQAMGSIATVVLRGPTQQILDDAERAVDDGVNSYRILGKDARTVPAGGCTEIQLSKYLTQKATETVGLDQYAILKFAEALEVVPRVLAENSGHSATDVVARLHAASEANAGLNLVTGQAEDLQKTRGVVDLFLTKWWAIKLAGDAVATVLKVDQIIMSKPAGGPKARAPGGDDD